MTDNDNVGYCRPPKASRFEKGQSGNPLGSSRKVRERKRRRSLSFDDLVLENSEKLLRVREGNRIFSVGLREAMIQKQNAMALQGNRLALKTCLDRIEKAEQNKRTEVLDHFETYLDYKENYPARAKFCRDRCLPPPLPHPDDVHFDRYTGELKLTGPRNLEELDQLKKILEARKTLMTMIEEHRSDADECARQGCPNPPGDIDTISLLENHLRSFDSELEKRGWLPRVAGEKES
jgi:hypothetical protein